MISTIKVTSHVARDFLQNSTYFNTVPKVVWEYVSNSIDNPRPNNSSVHVDVKTSKQRIVVSDDGCGMSREDLSNFFQMHGENIRRGRGEHVRGMYGTGKCAAFGIADSFRLETCQNHVLNVVELTRDDIEKSKSGSPFPIKDIVVNQSTEQDDGTRVIIKQLNIKNLDLAATISYVERHLGRQLHNHFVSINDHICQYDEPYATWSRSFRPEPDLAKLIGQIELIIKVSPTTLEKELAGIDILSRGIWHEIYLGNLEGEMSKRIFGEVDMPVLEDRYETEKIKPFDNTRNMTLNMQSPLVVSLLAWVDDCLIKVADELKEYEKEKRDNEEAKRLSKQARELESILNEDFSNLQMELERIRRLARQRELDVSDDLVPNGGEIQTDYQMGGPEHGDGHRGEIAGAGEEERLGSSLLLGDDKGGLGKISEQKRKQSTFRVEHRHEEDKSPRSHYERDIRTIVINIDHPQMVSSLRDGGGIESKQFREMTYEVAFVEYAIALGHEKMRYDQFYSGSDALFDIRDTINRVSRLM